MFVLKQYIPCSAATFVRKATDAIKYRREQVEAFLEFDAALPQEDTSQWTKLCKDWESDPSKDNPFLNQRIGGQTQLSFVRSFLIELINSHFRCRSAASVG